MIKQSKELKKISVILMTYGSPKTLDEVPQYLKNVYGGRDADPETIKEFQRRYDIIGGSPLIEITQAQAKALEKELNTEFKTLSMSLRGASTRATKQSPNHRRLPRFIGSQTDYARNDIVFQVDAGMRFSKPFIDTV